jgi:hypothetical protein
MKEAVAIAKEADAKKEFSSTKSDNSIHRVRNEPEMQIGSLRDVIGNIRRDGGTPSVESIATELSGMSTGGRAPALLALQKTHGNQYVQRVVSGIQAKLKVGQPGDIYEQEADRVADEVIRISNTEMRQQSKRGGETQTQLLAGRITSFLQRQVEEEEEELPQTGMMAAIGGESPGSLEAGITTLRSGGHSLPGHVRAFFEPRFGYDFGRVRIHTDSLAAETASSVNARAFTLGRDIVFGAGEYTPETTVGKRLLAHELTHVVQQRSAIARRRTREHADDAAVADRFADPILLAGGISHPIIQRQATIRRGSVGCPVPEAQEKLNVTGEALAVDGRFGPLTNAAVRGFQTTHSPPLGVDGVIGTNTWRELHAAAPGDHGLPLGETTNSNGWGAGNLATIHRWRQQLQPTTTSFRNCRVTEADPGGGTDGCHFPSSRIPPQTGITGGTWNVDRNNRWGDDWVGWSTRAVTYYRNERRAPCSARWPQSMRVVRPSGNVEYLRNTLVLTIGTTNVSSTRAGNTEIRAWP